MAFVFASAWLFNPSGQYEPAITLCTIALSAVAEIGRRSRPSEKDENEERRVNSHVKNDVSKSKKPEALIPSNSASFFAERFAHAFPGVRKIEWYEGPDAIKRLQVLLKEPLVFERENSETTPIWWWRGGNLQIPSFKVLRRGVVLLDTKEMKISRIAAVPSSSYYRSFVYVEASPMKPCGAYHSDAKKIARMVNDHGYAWEEYGLFKGKHVVSRPEYDDNAASIRGKLVKLGADVELRERYISPFNLLVASQLSPINNPAFDFKLVELMNGMLDGTTTIFELKAETDKLPKPPGWLHSE